MERNSVPVCKRFGDTIAVQSSNSHGQARPSLRKTNLSISNKSWKYLAFLVALASSIGFVAAGQENVTPDGMWLFQESQFPGIPAPAANSLFQVQERHTIGETEAQFEYSGEHVDACQPLAVFRCRFVDTTDDESSFTRIILLC
jgi:hypothetical protein